MQAVLNEHNQMGDLDNMISSVLPMLKSVREKRRRNYGF